MCPSTAYTWQYTGDVPTAVPGHLRSREIGALKQRHGARQALRRSVHGQHGLRAHHLSRPVPRAYDFLPPPWYPLGNSTRAWSDTPTTHVDIATQRATTNEESARPCEGREDRSYCTSHGLRKRGAHHSGPAPPSRGYEVYCPFKLPYLGKEPRTPPTASSHTAVSRTSKTAHR